jgi:hypothetical protein
VLGKGYLPRIVMGLWLKCNMSIQKRSRLIYWTGVKCLLFRSLEYHIIIHCRMNYSLSGFFFLHLYLFSVLKQVENMHCCVFTVHCIVHSSVAWPLFENFLSCHAQTHHTPRLSQHAASAQTANAHAASACRPDPCFGARFH